MFKGRTALVVLTSVSLWLQDYRVHIKHTDGHFEHVPYFSLPANDLTDVIAPSCYSCFDYPNALADLVSLCFNTAAMSSVQRHKFELSDVHPAALMGQFTGPSYHHCALHVMSTKCGYQGVVGVGAE